MMCEISHVQNKHVPTSYVTQSLQKLEGIVIFETILK